MRGRAEGGVGGEAAQQAKVLPAMPDGLSSVPWTYMVQEITALRELSSDPHMCAMTIVYTLAQSLRQKNRWERGDTLGCTVKPCFSKNK